MYESRVCISADLLHMCAMADKYEFNRRVETEKLVEVIDPNGISILECLMPYHRASYGPSKEPYWPDHHRCYVYCKVKDSDDPVNFFLDVEASFWDKLMTTQELQAKMLDPLETAIAHARAHAMEEDDDE